MKQKIQLSCLFAVAALLQGCAGYNTVMFMTKSNAGLDIDMKPPTAEISISRKEAVIAPAFEKGQTPPVMASFKPNVGFGNRFGNYFLGVDQTFAGGDAAMTMAMLYDEATFKGNGTTFNSELQLGSATDSSGAWWKDILTAPAKPGKIKPFIFGTDTMLGLKVAWSGVGGQFPDTVKAGFNRKEFAWAPVTMSEDKKVKMPSFLATIESNIGGGSETAEPSGTGTNGQNRQGGIKSIQYFATGEAANHLARQKDVRDAMLKRLDPRFGESLQIGKGPVARQMLFAMKLVFSELQDEDDIAKAHYKKLQNLQGVQVPSSFESAKKPMFCYEGDKDKGVFVKRKKKPILDKAGTITVSDVITYMSLLEESKSKLKLIKDQLDKHNIVSLSVDDGPPTPILSNTEIEEQLVIQDNEHRRIEQELAADRDITAAFDYLRNLTQR